MSIVERNRKWLNGNVFNNLERLDASFSDMLDEPTVTYKQCGSREILVSLIHSVVRKNEKTLTEKYFVEITLS